MAKFPLFLMEMDGKKQFLPMSEAGAAYDSGFSRVEMARLVLERDFSVRDITPEEEARISRIADAHSAGK